MDYFSKNRPLKNCSDISLMDDNQNEWGEEEPSDTKRFRVSRATHLTLTRYSRRSVLQLVLLH